MRAVSLSKMYSENNSGYFEDYKRAFEKTAALIELTTYKGNQDSNNTFGEIFGYLQLSAYKREKQLEAMAREIYSDARMSVGLFFGYSIPSIRLEVSELESDNGRYRTLARKIVIDKTRAARYYERINTSNNTIFNNSRDDCSIVGTMHHEVAHAVFHDLYKEGKVSFAGNTYGKIVLEEDILNFIFGEISSINEGFAFFIEDKFTGCTRSIEDRAISYKEDNKDSKIKLNPQTISETYHALSSAQRKRPHADFIAMIPEILEEVLQEKCEWLETYAQNDWFAKYLEIKQAINCIGAEKQNAPAKPVIECLELTA